MVFNFHLESEFEMEKMFSDLDANGSGGDSGGIGTGGGLWMLALGSGKKFQLNHANRI